MRIKLRDELLPLVILAILLIAAVIFFQSTILRIILGIPFVFFFPGYVLTAALFPRKEEMGGVERVGLGFGLSLAVVPLIGLILNYTAWGIRLESVLSSMILFILIASVIAWFRRERLPVEERFGIEFYIALPGWGKGAWDRVLSIILVTAVVGVLGTVGYTVAMPKVGEAFTEFYILSLDGKAEGYLRQLTAGGEGRVIVGIINREYQPISYRLELTIDGVKNNEIGAIRLGREEKWEETVSFTPTTAGFNREVEFLLYKEGGTEVYRRLHLWVDVVQ